MRLTQAHQDILDRAKRVAAEFGERVTEPYWAQDRKGDFLVFYVGGRRRKWIDFTDEMIEQHFIDGETWRIVEPLLRDAMQSGPESSRSLSEVT